MNAPRHHLPIIGDDGAEPDRPRTRGDCVGGPRPCPWVSCEAHAIHGVLLHRSAGRLTDDDVLATLDTMPASCTLDVADDGGSQGAGGNGAGGATGDAGTLLAIGNLWGITRERIRQIETKGLSLLKNRVEHLRDVITEEPEIDLRPARAGAARFVEERRRLDPPAQHSHLSAPETVQRADEGMWCPWMGAAMTGGMCARRHVARNVGSLSKGGSPTRSFKTYPQCADCTDGAAVATRLGTDAPVVPLRQVLTPRIAEIADAAARVSARAIDWMGDDDAPANDTNTNTNTNTNTEDEMSMGTHRKEAAPAASPTTKTTSSAPARCTISRCKEPPCVVRHDTHPEVVTLCRTHRHAVAKARHTYRLTTTDAVRRVEVLAAAGITRKSSVDAVRRALLAAGIEAGPPRERKPPTPPAPPEVSAARAYATEHAAGTLCVIPGCGSPAKRYRDGLEVALRQLCAVHRQKVQVLRAQRKWTGAQALVHWIKLHASPDAQESIDDALLGIGATTEVQHVEEPCLTIITEPSDEEAVRDELSVLRAQLARVTQERDDLARFRPDGEDNQALLRLHGVLGVPLLEPVAELVRVAIERIDATPSTTSPWNRLIALAKAVRGGAETWWSVCGYTGPKLPQNGTGWVVEAHDCDDDPEGRNPLWAGYGWTVDGAIGAAIRELEGAARQRVEEITAALEGVR